MNDSFSSRRTAESVQGPREARSSAGEPFKSRSSEMCPGSQTLPSAHRRGNRRVCAPPPGGTRPRQGSGRYNHFLLESLRLPSANRPHVALSPVTCQALIYEQEFQLKGGFRYKRPSKWTDGTSNIDAFRPQNVLRAVSSDSDCILFHLCCRWDGFFPALAAILPRRRSSLSRCLRMIWNRVSPQLFFFF